MMFCEKCGSILIPKKDDRKTVLFCNSCGSASKKKETIILKEKVQLSKKDQIEVVDKKVETLPKIKEKCSKCGHPEAYYWLVQTRAGDEAETRFFRCAKCNHVWRAY